MVVAAFLFFFHEFATFGFQVQTQTAQKSEAAVPNFFSLNCAPCFVPGTGVFSRAWIASSSFRSMNAVTLSPLRNVALFFSQPRWKKLTTFAFPPWLAPG